jgi:hypothetical protein
VTTSADYIADELLILKQTPMMVGMTMLLAAKHGPISITKEASALADALTELPPAAVWHQRADSGVACRAGSAARPDDL